MRQRPSGAGNPGLLMQLLFTLLFTVALLSAHVTAAIVESASQQSLEPEIHLERERGDPRAVARYVPQPITDVSDAQYNEPAAVQQGHTPRSISQYNEDFVLLATVDGRLSARDRKSGKLKWELVTQDPAVRTTYHRANATRDAQMRPEDIDADDLIEWIVGPTEAGELYFFTPGKNGGRLEKLDVTVKDIIHNTPYKPANVNKVYNGGKTTVTYAINARTGVIERIFSADGFHQPLNDKKCKVALANIDEEECEVEDKEEDDQIIMIGRTEYTITIQNWKTGEPLWTIKFNEWTPNNSDTDLRVQHQRPSDNRYIYSRHDGTIFGFSSPEDVAGEKKPLFTAQLDTPVVGVYDVLAPRDGTNELLVLPQPPYAAGDFNSDLLDQTYVGATEEGAWYALSERNLPYVTNQAKDATCYDYIDKWPLLPQSERQRRLVGKHKVHNRQVGDRTAYFNKKKISGTLPGKVSNRRFISSGAASPTSERLLAIGFPEDSWGARKLPVAFAAAITVLLLGYFAINKPGTLLVPRLAAEVQQKAMHAVPDVQKPIIDSQSIKSIPETVVIPPVTEDSALAAPPVSAEVVVAPTDQSIVLEEKTIDAEVEINVSTEITKQHAVPMEPGKPAKNHVHFVEPEPSTSPDGSETPKKKYARGRRGGKKKKRAQSDPETPSIPGDQHVSPPSVEEAVLDDGSVSAESVISGADAPKQSGSVTSDRENEHPTGEGRVLSTGQVEQKDGSTFILGRLEYDEKAIIGSGSQGTTVFKGKWEGRVVAIKRMLTTHAELAHKEVKLLQEADDHFNVVRYHCQQRWGEFLFIALELCRCSLYDLIAKPQEFEDLRKGFEPANCLFQIMDGLRHLHMLNIVHRDIKPQNILVGDPFNTDRVKTPRYLISDFGLCKKLQEDEYSFAATTAQHAGTFGWRAPELLNEYSVPWPSTGLSQNSEPSGGDGTPSSGNPRRATSKIDIFSAGCLFYFVCSGGRHPFGDRYDREYNIIRNNYNLDDLKGQEGMGEEAIELISSMIDQDPKKRPDCDTVGKHPFFWSPVKRLDFLCIVSDRLEMIKLELKSLDKKATDFTIPDLEANRQEVIGTDWTKALCKAMNSELFAVKRRGYSGSNICDLLRAIRNKRHHWGDMQEDAKRATGELPADYVNYWQRRLPKMLMHVYRFVKKRKEATFEERNNGGAVVMLGGTSTAFDEYFRGF